jgi:Esterase-like activity of phytase
LHACSSGNKFFSLSDNRDNGRFYTVQLDVDDKQKQLTATITDVVTMLDISGNGYAASTIDPESVRYDRQSETLVWYSEGDAKQLIPPLITEMSTAGNYIGTVPFSKRFAVSCLRTLGTHPLRSPRKLLMLFG